MSNVATPVNTQLRLAHRPVGFAKASDWDLVTAPAGTPADGEFLVRVRQLSLDPAMRGWMNANRSYIPPVEIGAVMRAFGVGEVIASRHAAFAVGDLVTGEFGAQNYAICSGDGVERIDPSIEVPTSAYLGVLGLTGLTAYFGLLDIGEFVPGQTVFISGAAGAVGSTVGQIVKILGGTAIGTAGGPDKCAYLVDELGFDAAIDYKSEDVAAGLRRHAPEGVNVFFDNVGADILDAGLANLAHGARVVICGAISQYNATEVMPGPVNYRALLVKRARMEGLIVFDYQDRYGPAIQELAQWLADGKLTGVEDIVDGTIEDFPATLMRLFEGKNVGKQILQLRTPESD